MKKKRLAGVFLAMAMLLAACGSNESASQNDATATESIEKVAVEDTVETQAAETEDTQEEIVIKLGVPKAPPTLPVLKMIEDNALGENVTIELDIWDAPEQLLAMVQDGDHQMFAFPLTVVSKLYNKGLDVRLTNVNTWGVTYFVTTDETLTDWAQLKGKTVYVPLQSSPPDVLTQFFLNEAGLTVGEDVEIIYSTTAEISQMLADGSIEYATLIEPQVTAAKMKNENVRVAFSFEEEWKKVKGDDSTVPNAGFGTTQTFIDENPELVAEFETAYEDALEWVLENPAEAGTLAEKYLGLKAGLVEQAIPNMGLNYVSAADAKTDLDGFYQLLADFDATMIGGTIPDDGMYYAK